MDERAESKESKATEKIRAAVFSAAVAIVLLSLLAYLGISAVAPELGPDEQLDLESKNTALFPKMTLESLATGDFQSDFEEAAGDRILCRDEVLLVNAAVQRLSIKVANLPFGYKAFPTYYGSNNIEAPGEEIVCDKPNAKSETRARLLGKSADELEGLAQNIDGKKVACVVENIGTSSVNPGSGLVKNEMDSSYIRKNFLEKLGSSWGTVFKTYDSLDEYKDDFYRTDHHWKTGAAVRAYRQIMSQLDRKPISVSAESSAGWGAFYGSRSRSGVDLDVQADEVTDVFYEHSTLSVKVDGEEKGEDFLDAEWASDGGESRRPQKSYGAHYSNRFYLPSEKLIVIENASCDDGGTLLLIADSYASCIARFFAESYSRVVVVDPRMYANSLRQLADDYDVDDLVCIACPYTLYQDKTVKLLSS